MSTEDVIPRIERVFGNVFGTGVDFGLEVSRAEEPRWTSFKHVELLIALEVEFGVRFDGADATDMVSIPTVVDRIERKLRQ
jgi:acyl carrier protein